MEKLVVAAEQSSDSTTKSTTETLDTREINASGHPQELERNFGLLSICGIGIITGNSWTALGGSIVCSSSPWMLPVHESGYTDIMAEVASYRSLRYTMAVQPARSTSCSSISDYLREVVQSLSCTSIAVSCFYMFIAASIAELASAMPSSSGGSPPKSNL